MTASTARRIFSHTEMRPMPRTPYCSKGRRERVRASAAAVEAAAAGPQPQPWHGVTPGIAAGGVLLQQSIAASDLGGLARTGGRLACGSARGPVPGRPDLVLIGSQATHPIVPREGSREVLPLRCSLRAHPCCSASADHGKPNQQFESRARAWHDVPLLHAPPGWQRRRWRSAGGQAAPIPHLGQQINSTVITEQMLCTSMAGQQVAKRRSGASAPR